MIQKRVTGEKKLHRYRAIPALLLAVLMIIWVIPSEAFATGPSVRIGHAVHGEKGGLKGNKAGDYKGREVYIENWNYSMLSGSRYHWKYVFRAKDHDLAEGIARNMEAICKNNRIGYDQNSPDSTSLYDKAEEKGWDISAVNSWCETTCSNAVSVCLNAEGVDVPKNWNTSRMRKDLVDTGMFECIKAKAYVKSSDKLVEGDILLNPGHHTAVVVESSNPFTYTLRYTKTDGKTAKVFIEEDTYIQINPNNSTEPMRVLMDDNMELTEEDAYLRDHILEGWVRTDSTTFTARYKAERLPMRLSGKKVKI